MENQNEVNFNTASVPIQLCVQAGYTMGYLISIQLLFLFNPLLHWDLAYMARISIQLLFLFNGHAYSRG